MARRASTVSTTSLVSSTARVESVQSGYFDASTSLTKVNGQGHPQSRSASGNLPKYHQHDSRIDPDELFTQRTVVEVKAVQSQLRADADAKQEELRLMVGERYRDLLQASTSIISIARSSKRVIEALEETKDTILSQEEPPLPKRASLLSKEDAHLQTLQLLSAHIKLLLDAPEHLWRLIERKKYFQAAWLFLLARVVHRALIRDDDQDDENWGSQGIDVMEQFPLIQRQWDAVSHFRTQIIHKATLSLRSHTAPSEDTCATLLTLHLLDSRPLAETLSLLLTQRSKTLHTLLAKSREASEAISSGRPNNNHALDNKNHAISPKRRIRDVKRSAEVVLDAISRTVRTARDIFEVDPKSHHSMMTGVLEYIQSEEPDQRTFTFTLPSELLLTTQTLLTALPSSTHFLLLPANLRSYKPYVDLSSSSSSMSQSRFALQLDEWLQGASKRLQGTLATWFSSLHSVPEVWSVRTWIRTWVATASRLEELEQNHINQILDDASRQRIVSIWKLVLEDAANEFRDKIGSSVSDLLKESGSNAGDPTTVEHLFAASPLPTVSRSGPGPSSIDSSFQKYKTALQQQMCGRTALLDDAVGPLESRAERLQHDFLHTMSGDDENTRLLADQLKELYRPDAEALCSGAIDALESISEDLINRPDAMNSLAFVGRVADELSSSSEFLSAIGCGHQVAEVFRAKAAALHARIISKWRTHTVSQVNREYWISWPTSRGLPTDSSFPPCPSTALMLSLISLSTSIQRLGISRDAPRLGHIASDTLSLFVIALLESADGQSPGWRAREQQALCDLTLLRVLGALWVNGWHETFTLMDEKVAQLQSKLQPEDIFLLTSSVKDHFSRTQVLLAPLLPLPNLAAASPAKDNREKFTTLLSFGMPTSEVQLQPALELAKPSSRFGLLLIGGTQGQ